MRPLRAICAALLVLGLAACSDDAGSQLPDRAADVRGGVTTHDGASGAVLIGASDQYYEGMSLLVGTPVVVDAGGEARELTDLFGVEEVEVWVTGPCQESFPVQCEIEALRVMD